MRNIFEYAFKKSLSSFLGIYAKFKLFLIIINKNSQSEILSKQQVRVNYYLSWTTLDDF